MSLTIEAARAHTGKFESGRYPNTSFRLSVRLAGGDPHQSKTINVDTTLNLQDLFKAVKDTESAGGQKVDCISISSISAKHETMGVLGFEVENSGKYSNSLESTGLTYYPNPIVSWESQDGKQHAAGADYISEVSANGKRVHHTLGDLTTAMQTHPAKGLYTIFSGNTDISDGIPRKVLIRFSRDEVDKADKEANKNARVTCVPVPKADGKFGLLVRDVRHGTLIK